MLSLIVAKEIREVIAQYDPNYMAASLDEAYLNMTNYIQEHDINPEEAVTQLRAEIFEKTKITTSAGLGASTIPISVFLFLTCRVFSVPCVICLSNSHAFMASHFGPFYFSRSLLIKIRY